MRIEIEEGSAYHDFQGPSLKIVCETEEDAFGLGIMFEELKKKHKVPALAARHEKHPYIKVPMMYLIPKVSDTPDSGESDPTGD